jgi:hypothetical protein
MAMQSVDRSRYLETFNDVLSMSDRTDQYSDRLHEFIKFRKDNFHETYWIGKTSGEQQQ